MNTTFLCVLAAWAIISLGFLIRACYRCRDYFSMFFCGFFAIGPMPGDDRYLAYVMGEDLRGFLIWVIVVVAAFTSLVWAWE